MSALQNGDDDNKPACPELVEGGDGIIERQLGFGETHRYSCAYRDVYDPDN
jgi:hypothetical protein